MAVFYPAWDKIAEFAAEPTEGEWTLLNFLHDHLDDSYEVYYQVHLNGEMPDIIVMRRSSGVLIIEVKDWNLACYEYYDAYNWRVRSKPDILVRSPVQQVECYKAHLYSYHIPGLAEKKALKKGMYRIIETMVYFHNATNREIAAFFPELPDYTTLVGGDELQRFSFKNKMGKYLGLQRQSFYFTDALYALFKQALQPVEHDLLIGEPLSFNKKQDSLSQSAARRHQKICGAAGSGKTQTLARIAVNAYERTHQTVLILTFNITLPNYIHDLIRRVDNDVDWNCFIIRHYHLFMQMYMNDNDIPSTNVSAVDTTLLQGYTGEKFKTIIVDEVQDFKKEWVQNIWQLLDKDGEIIFAGDEKQNIYGREMDEKEKKPFTGIGGRWNVLTSTYRQSTPIADLANDFQRKFLSRKYNYEAIVVEQGTLLFQEYPVKYYFLEEFDSDKIIRLFGQMMRTYGFHFNDACFLGGRVEELRILAQDFERDGIRTTTTFESEETYGCLQKKVYHDQAILPKNRYKVLEEKLDEIRRSKKFNFWMNTGCVKLSTTHSFKGWEIKTLVLILHKDYEKEEKAARDELIYTALTRCREHLMIINIGNRFYDEFFSNAIEKILQ